MRTAREHFLFARERALEYVEAGDGAGAISSLISDLGNHEGTRAILAESEMTMLAMGEVMIAGAEGARRFIQGLPVPSDAADDKVTVVDVAGTDEPVVVDRDDVASSLRTAWFWDAPEDSREQVFAWLDDLQRALNRNEPTADLEAALGIRIEEG